MCACHLSSGGGRGGASELDLELMGRPSHIDELLVSENELEGMESVGKVPAATPGDLS